MGNCCFGIFEREFSASDWDLWLGSLPRPVIFCGDLNAHHPLWGGLRQNRKGAIVASSLLNHDLVVLNDGTTTL